MLKGRHTKLRLPFVLLAIGLLSVGVAACGGADANTSSTSQSSSTSAAIDGAKTTTSSTSTTKTSLPPQTDDYISTYGHEATGSVKQAVTTLVKRYYAAAAADNGAAACSMIYSTLEESVAEDYGRAPGPPGIRGNTCTEVMTKLFKRVPGQPPAVLAKTKVTGVRLKGNHGFVQLSSSAIPTGKISVELEGKSWKVLVLTGSACTRCGAG